MGFSGISHRLSVGLSSAFLGLSLLALGLSPARQAQAASRADQRIQDATAVLERTEEGRFLLESARAFWRVSTNAELAKKALRNGDVSRTDAVLTRNFDTLTGEETRDRAVTVFLHTSQPLESLVLDLAHELVHATTRPSWDPYDPDLTPVQYIRSAIDGPGGEVEAVAAECRVALELAGNYGTSARRCQGYRRGTTAHVDRDKITEDFYRVGTWYAELSRGLGPEIVKLTKVSRQDPKLISSTGEAPYPVALLNEYKELTVSACRNSQVRSIASIRVPDAGKVKGRGRKPASAHATERFLARRCAQVGATAE